MERFAEITDNLFRGSAPNFLELGGLQDIFGIRKIVSLDGDVAKNIHPWCQKLNLKHLIIPITSDHNFERLLSFLKNNILEILSNNGPVFVHCYHGKDRTGLAVALFRVKVMGWSPEEALQEAEDFDFGIGVSPSIVEIYKNCIMNSEDSNSAYDSDEIVGGLAEKVNFAPPNSYPYVRSAQQNKQIFDNLMNQQNKSSIPDTSKQINEGISGWAPVEIARQRLPWTLT